MNARTIRTIEDFGNVQAILTAQSLGMSFDENHSYTVLITERDGLRTAHALFNEEIKNDSTDKIDLFLNTTRHQLESRSEDKTLAHTLKRHYVAKDLIINAVSRYGKDLANNTKKNDVEKTVETMILDADKLSASDIHVTVGKSSKIMFRVNGELEVYGHERNQEILNNIVSVLYSHMAAKDGDIDNEEFKPDEQADAVLYRDIEGKRFGLRITTHPTQKTGMDYHMVMRALGNQNEYAKRTPFEKLGFMYDQPNRIQQALRAKGMVLTIGETNSGKSVSQQNYLMLLDEERKGTAAIYSIENPIERQISGVTQFNLSDFKAIDGSNDPDKQPMAVLLKYIMRADPDVLAMAEIRDYMTAQAAQKLSQTGHKVFGTLHCDSPFDFFERLVGLGCDEATLRSGEVLGAVISQKLFKKLCPVCSHSIHTIPSVNEKQMLAIEQLSQMGLGHKLHLLRFRNNDSAGHCGNPECNKGLVGRQLIAECVNISDEILTCLANGDKRQAKKTWLSNKNFTKMDCALTAMFQGQIDSADVVNELGDVNASYKLRQEFNLQHPKVIYA